MRVEVHFDGPEKPERGRWACGASLGPASGDFTQVDCPACMGTEAFQRTVAEHAQAEEAHLALSLPPQTKVEKTQPSEMKPVASVESVHDRDEEES